MKTILVLGKSGQLATHLQNLSSDHFKIKALSRNELNLNAVDEIQPTLKKYSEFDLLINAAAYTNTRLAENTDKQLALNINGHALEQLGLFCRENAIPIIHISTDFVFDGAGTDPYKETAATNPLNQYGLSKMLGEELLQRTDCEFSIIRTSSVFGQSSFKNQNVQNFVDKVVEKIQTGEELQMVDDIIMSPTYAKDLAQFILELVQKDKPWPKLIHFSNSGQCSWFEFALEIARLLGTQNQLSSTSYLNFKNDIIRPPFSVLDGQLAETIMPRRDWKTALKDYMQIKGYL